MRILVIAPEQLPVPPVKGGSVETCIYSIFRRMAHTDQVTILSRSHPRLPRVSPLTGGQSRIIRVGYHKRLQYIQAALKLVQRNRFDVIQIENRPSFVPYVRKAFPHTPIVLSLHSLTFMSQLTNARANQILRQVNGVTTVSKFVTQWMKNRYPQHAQKFRTAISGVETDLFRPRPVSFKQSVRQRWKLANQYNILFVGRIIPGKGLHTLVRAVALLRKRYPDMAVVAVGASWPGVQKLTAYMRQIVLLCQQLKVPIRFTGYLPPGRVATAYHLGDVFVCPSMFREGLTLVSLEAMASGIPVIASKRGGIQEAIVQGKTGLLVSDFRSPAAFAREIEKIRRSPMLARSLSAAGLRRVRTAFSWDRTVQQLKNHYQSLIKR